ncbi:MAG: ABC transporter permease [Culicoidibacterales bacterium]
MKKNIWFRFKILKGQKVSLFWACIFPLLLAFIFSLVFKNLMAETLKFSETINVSFVDMNQNPELVTLFELLENDGKKVFSITENELEEGTKLLANDEVSGVVVGGENIQLNLKRNDIKSSYIKSVLDGYEKTKSTYTTIISQNSMIITPEKVDNMNTLKPVNLDEIIGDTVLIPFMSSIAMGVMYASYFALRLSNTINPAKTSGMRLVISPYSRYKIAFIDTVLVSITTVSIGFIIYFFINNILRVDIAGDIKVIIGLFALSGLVVSFFGYIAGTIFSRFSNIVSINILWLLILSLSFMTGMMTPVVKLSIEENMPILHRINPVYLITDTLYNLKFDQGVEAAKKVSENFTSLGLIVIVLGTITMLLLRRKTYDNS